MTNDPIADMLTRVRNANLVQMKTVSIPNTKVTFKIANILKEEGFIQDVSLDEKDVNQKALFFQITLKYFGKNNQPVLTHLQRISKPGRRIYVNSKSIPDVLGGIGVSLISTSKGVMTNRHARQQNLGGEILCNIY